MPHCELKWEIPNEINVRRKQSMKALRYYGKKDIRLEDVPEPSPGEGEVKIKVKACGICGSDIVDYETGPTNIPKVPITFGHEFSGEVVELGKGVSGINTGERVTVNPGVYCYKCFRCMHGQYMACVNLKWAGTVGEDGGFAAYAVVQSEQALPIPETMSYEAAAFVEPTMVGVHACKRAELKPGDDVVVVGAGPIGLLTLQVAKATGAGKVFVVEPLANRRKIALELGATKVFDPGDGDASIKKEITALTNGVRAEIVFQSAGPLPAMLTAQKLCRVGGKIVMMAQMPKSGEFAFEDMFLREQSIISSWGCVPDEYLTAIAYLADGRVRFEPLISARIKLEDVIQKGFQELSPGKEEERNDKHCKILVFPE
jgi:(R,R)-butanediol dehydrogenase/meso-butanediol dehydrogenase/diacetyl reductase